MLNQLFGECDCRLDVDESGGISEAELTEGVFLLCGTRIDQAGFRCLVGASLSGDADAEVGCRFCDENGIMTKELFKKVCCMHPPSACQPCRVLAFAFVNGVGQVHKHHSLVWLGKHIFNFMSNLHCGQCKISARASLQQ